MQISITGAAGRVGREITATLKSDHDLTLIDRRPIETGRSIVADLSVPVRSDESNDLTRALRQTEVLIHLAEDPRPGAPWQQVLTNNIGATWNMTRLAVDCGVRRMIYASSHWAVRGLELELAPSYRMRDGRKIGAEAPLRPINYYGIGKICGELTGKMLVETGGLESFVAVRIGCFDPDVTDEQHRRSLGISSNDLCSLFRRCVEAKFSGFHVIYGVSRQPSGPFDLSHAAVLLDWHPTEVAS